MQRKKHIKATVKRLFTALLSLTLTAALALNTAAYNRIPIILDGEPAAIDARLIGSTTYVELEGTDSLIRSRTSANETAVGIEAEPGIPYISARGRYIGGESNLELDGKLFVPIRSLAKLYGVKVGWQSDSRSVTLDTSQAAPIKSGDAFYREDEVYWLSKIINAESGGEPLLGKVLVGNVVMNRVRSSDFPNTIYSVIFDRKYGVQFTPIANGTIYNAPNAESVIAAKLVLDGWSLSRDALYFLNPRIATSFWIVNNRQYITSVGGHDFYS